MSLKLLAIDLGKRSFHIHGIDSDGVIISRKTSRSKLFETIKELAPETIAMEACASAHYWGRRFLAAGHRVLLINPRFMSQVAVVESTNLIMPAVNVRAGVHGGAYRRSERAKQIGDWAEKVAVRFIQEQIYPDSLKSRDKFLAFCD